ncbi:Lipoprotein OS=Ureibacillus acetophenoni OX=614649 GN=SAMN05877842_102375 PE=4 SV=1 [Ureibacillus acetophenoni]
MKFVKYVLLIILATSLSACSLNNEESPLNEFNESITEVVSNTTGLLENASQVLTYVQTTQGTFQEILNISSQWTNTFNALSNGEITNEQLASVVTNEILPLNESLMTQIEGFIPPTNATAMINDVLLNAVTTQNEALENVVKGIQSGDYSVVNSANEMISNVQGFEGQFTKMIQDIITQYGF